VPGPVKAELLSLSSPSSFPRSDLNPAPAASGGGGGGGSARTLRACRSLRAKQERRLSPFPAMPREALVHQGADPPAASQPFSSVSSPACECGTPSSCRPTAAWVDGAVDAPPTLSIDESSAAHGGGRTARPGNVPRAAS